MDHNRDNPLKRFSAFWIAFLLVGSFGIACVILRPMTHGKIESAYKVRAEERLEVKNDLQKAGDGALSAEKIEKASKATLTNFNQAPSKGTMALPSASE